MTSLALACRLGAVTAPRSIPRRVRAILNKYGATMLLPGVAEPILGPELVATLVPGSGAVLTQDANDVTVQLVGGDTFGNGNCSISVTAGKQYRIMGNIVSSTGTPNFGLSTTATGATDLLNLSSLGVRNQIYTATTTGSIFLQVGVSGANAQTFATGLSFREILGYSNTYASFQSGNYRESTGQTLAAADQQVGLVVDAAGSAIEMAVTAAIGVGGGFVNNGDGSYTKPVGVEGSLAINGNSVPSGNYVRFRFEVVSLTGNITPYVGGAIQSTITSVGPKEINAQSGASILTEASIYCSAANSVTVRAISVRELPGIHASQSTSGYQPVLRNTAGIQSWQFDGTDDRLSLSAVPFQMADDHFVVGGATVSGSGTRILFSIRNTSSTFPIVAQVFVASNGVLTGFWRNAENTNSATPGVSAPSGAFTFSARKAGASCSLRANGGAWATVSAPGGTFPVNNAVLGASAENSIAPFSGNCHGIIFGKGAITDSELLTLERFMATLQGRTL